MALPGLLLVAVVVFEVFSTPPVAQAFRPANALRPFDRLRVVPSKVEGRPAQATVLRPIARSETQPSTQPAGLGVEQLAWIAGCWEMVSARRTVEEHWLAPRGQTMLGMSRTVRGDRTTDHEFVVIRQRDGGLAYEAHPSGQAPAVFLSRSVTDASVVFENAEHDFPQRIGYERRGPDSLLAWIEGTQGGRVRRVDFPYQRVPCR